MAYVGQLAHDFELTDQGGETHMMSRYRGQNVLLSSHPYSFGGR